MTEVNQFNLYSLNADKNNVGVSTVLNNNDNNFNINDFWKNIEQMDDTTKILNYTKQQLGIVGGEKVIEDTATNTLLKVKIIDNSIEFKKYNLDDITTWYTVEDINKMIENFVKEHTK